MMMAVTQYSMATFDEYVLVHTNAQHYAGNDDAIAWLKEQGTADDLWVFTHAEDRDEMDTCDAWFDDTQLKLVEHVKMDSYWTKHKGAMAVYEGTDGRYWVKKAAVWDNEFSLAYTAQRKEAALAMANAALAA